MDTIYFKLPFLVWLIPIEASRILPNFSPLLYLKFLHPLFYAFDVCERYIQQLTLFCTSFTNI